jgi:acyl-CoA thioester hydrolase
MNVTWYTGKFDEATWNLFAACGMTSHYMREKRRGMAGVQQNITYKRELYAGDVVSVRTKVVELRERVVRWLHQMVHEGEVVCVSELTAVHMDHETRRAVAFEPEIAERIRAMVQ